MKTIWIGWPGIFVNDEVKQEKIRQILAKDNLVPVFHQKEQVDKYLEFHEKVLRPLFHNFKQLESEIEDDFEKQKQLWSVYKDFNEAYMDPIISNLDNMRDIIWIHDTYLMLLPKFARRTFINGCIGFSMHSPFPSSDIYKMFEHRKFLLKSLLCCDLIGFHIYEHARHFFTSCNRLLGLNHVFK